MTARFIAAALLLAAALPAAAQTATEETALAYCGSLADAAEDARYANKLARIAEAEKAVEDRIAALEAKRRETEDWLTRRETFLKLAEQNLVAIYAGMAPDAAAEQLAAMSELTAAAVIAKVPPRTASSILNEMQTEKAARLAQIMTGLSRTEEAQDDRPEHHRAAPSDRSGADDARGGQHQRPGSRPRSLGARPLPFRRPARAAPSQHRPIPTAARSRGKSRASTLCDCRTTGAPPPRRRPPPATDRPRNRSPLRRADDRPRTRPSGAEQHEGARAEPADGARSDRRCDAGRRSLRRELPRRTPARRPLHRPRPRGRDADRQRPRRRRDRLRRLPRRRLRPRRPRRHRPRPDAARRERSAALAQRRLRAVRRHELVRPHLLHAGGDAGPRPRGRARPHHPGHAGRLRRPRPPGPVRPRLVPPPAAPRVRLRRHPHRHRRGRRQRRGDPPPRRRRHPGDGDRRGHRARHQGPGARLRRRPGQPVERQARLQEETNRSLEEQVRKTLVPFLGVTNFTVSVTSRLNIDKTVENETIFDPESRVERSVRTVKEQQSARNRNIDQPVTVQQNIPQEELPTAGGADATEEQQRKEETINYEIAQKTVERVRDGFAIERLSVAVLVNQERLDANAQLEGAPAAAAQLADIEALVRTAAGLSADRGDELKVATIAFAADKDELEPLPEEGLLAILQNQMGTIVNALIVLTVAALLILFGLRPAIRALTARPNGTALPQLIAGADADADGAAAIQEERNLIEDLKAKIHRTPQARLMQVVDYDEKKAATLLKQWLLQGEHA